MEFQIYDFKKKIKIRFICFKGAHKFSIIAPATQPLIGLASLKAKKRPDS